MKFRAAISVFLVCWGLSACDTVEGTVALGIIGATVVGGQAPKHYI